MTISCNSFDCTYVTTLAPLMRRLLGSSIKNIRASIARKHQCSCHKPRVVMLIWPYGQLAIRTITNSLSILDGFDPVEKYYPNWIISGVKITNTVIICNYLKLLNSSAAALLVAVCLFGVSSFFRASFLPSTRSCLPSEALSTRKQQRINQGPKAIKHSKHITTGGYLAGKIVIHCSFAYH